MRLRKSAINPNLFNKALEYDKNARNLNVNSNKISEQNMQDFLKFISQLTGGSNSSINITPQISMANENTLATNMVTNADFTTTFSLSTESLAILRNNNTVELFGRAGKGGSPYVYNSNGTKLNNVKVNLTNVVAISMGGYVGAAFI